MSKLFHSIKVNEKKINISVLLIVNREGRGKTAWSLSSNSMVLSTLPIIVSRCSWKFNLVSWCIPRCFWEWKFRKGLWLKFIESWFIFWCFLEKIKWLELKLIFHCIVLPNFAKIIVESIFRMSPHHELQEKGKYNRQIA